MNQCADWRSGQGGFTTCLVLRITENGTLTVANAGHLAPYLQGEELLQLENGLPLGLAAEAVYPETTFRKARILLWSLTALWRPAAGPVNSWASSVPLCCRLSPPNPSPRQPRPLGRRMTSQFSPWLAAPRRRNLRPFCPPRCRHESRFPRAESLDPNAGTPPGLPCPAPASTSRSMGLSNQPVRRSGCQRPEKVIGIESLTGNFPAVINLTRESRSVEVCSASKAGR